MKQNPLGGFSCAFVGILAFLAVIGLVAAYVLAQNNNTTNLALHTTDHAIEANQEAMVAIEKANQNTSEALELAKQQHKTLSDDLAFYRGQIAWGEFKQLLAVPLSILVGVIMGVCLLAVGALVWFANRLVAIERRRQIEAEIMR